ncbi:hypothetical protein NDU88_003237 [Pleurodeles waltl]|uniref:Uncharacterized protein n=1 Tax=Pleurodeles waltl TaxID=8319 RepID=A0AAV7Q943_PLEWA|nr:hypothetical protein NDU88_003237 [Pleurodeles waltl]
MPSGRLTLNASAQGFPPPAGSFTLACISRWLLGPRRYKMLLLLRCLLRVTALPPRVKNQSAIRDTSTLQYSDKLI